MPTRYYGYAASNLWRSAHIFASRTGQASVSGEVHIFLHLGQRCAWFPEIEEGQVGCSRLFVENLA